MRKRKYMSILLFIGFLLSCLTATYAYIKHQDRLTQRYHLLCEVLKPGMSKDNVLDILKQTGEIVVVGGESPSPNFELHIIFVDPIGKDTYRSFDLGFKDYKYVSAYIRGFENLDMICDFHNQIMSATPTYSP